MASETKQHIDALAELHTDTSAADRVRQLLAEADTANERARQKRIEAGRLLIYLRAEYPKNWRRKIGISGNLAERLIQMATT